MKIQDLFFDWSNDRALHKRMLLHRVPRVICPVYPEQPQRYRISWENLNYFVNSVHDRLNEMLAPLQGGPEVMQYVRLPQFTTGTQLFVESLQAQLIHDFLDYDPANGFDIEAYLLAPSPTQPTFMLEIFPRQTAGVIVTDYGSQMMILAPFHCRSTDVVKGVPQGLVSLILAEGMVRGKSQKEAWDEWVKFKGGMWELGTTFVQGLFVGYLSGTVMLQADPELREHDPVAVYDTDDMKTGRALLLTPEVEEPPDWLIF